MSYKKFNDLQNLYEGVVSESNEIDEYTELVYNVIIAEMVYRDHSESVIRTYVENISEEQILEKVESFVSLEEYDLNEEQTDLLFSFYQEQQILTEGWANLKNLKNIKNLKNLKNADVLKNIKGSGAKLKNMVMSIFGKGKGSTKQLNLDLKGAKDGPGLLQKLKNLKTSTGNQLNKVKSKFDRKVTKTSEKLLGPDGKPLKTTKVVNPINKKNAAITGGLAVVGGTAALTGNNNKKKVEANKKEDDTNNAIEKQVDKYVADRKNPGGINKDLTIDNSEAGKAKYAEKAAERQKSDKKAKYEADKTAWLNKTRNSPAQKSGAFDGDTLYKQHLKHNDFKTMQAKSMMPGAKPGAAKAEFAAKYPTSNVAKDLKKSKRVTQVMDLESYDAYDLVLNYIMESKQASTIEEANYIMIEMDQNTIHEIVEEQKKTLIEWKKRAVGAAILAAPWALSELEKRWNPVKKARDKYQDKKATEYEKKSGTTKEDGYFR